MRHLSGTIVTPRAAGGDRQPDCRRVAAVGAVLFSAVAAAACAGLPPAPDPSRLAALPCRQVAPAAPIAWWSAASRYDRDDLARWCETVGPVLFEPPRASHEPPPT